jgi:nitrite reductase (cytochrome c-552)
MIEGVQGHYRQRRVEVGERLAVFNDAFAAAIESGSLDDARLLEIRALNREAQWYWDWMFTENSDGVHNPVQSRECLDRAEELIGQAEALLP